jgi:hypothetical protein
MPVLFVFVSVLVFVAFDIMIMAPSTVPNPLDVMSNVPVVAMAPLTTTAFLGIGGYS